MASAGASGVSRKETQWRSRPGGGGGRVKVGAGAVFLVRASEGAGPVSRALLEADGAAPRRRGWVEERGGGGWEWGTVGLVG